MCPYRFFDFRRKAHRTHTHPFSCAVYELVPTSHTLLYAFFSWYALVTGNDCMILCIFLWNSKGDSPNSDIPVVTLS